MLKYLWFVWDCGVCGNDKVTTSYHLKLVISMTKVLQKSISTYHC